MNTMDFELNEKTYNFYFCYKNGATISRRDYEFYDDDEACEHARNLLGEACDDSVAVEVYCDHKLVAVIGEN